MPWNPEDAQKHTRKAKSPHARKVWAKISDAVLSRTGDEGRAIREANAAVKRMKGNHGR
jgi:hypothetical protein